MKRTKLVVAGFDPKTGELAWKTVPMERWEMEMFRLHYKGDFPYQWMWLCNLERNGWEFEDQDQEGL